MKKILLSMAVVATALCTNAQTFHAITDGETQSCSQEAIAASDWISYNKTNYNTRSKCVEAGESIPNLSKSERVVTFTVSGCASFNVTAEGNTAVRSLIISADGTVLATQDWANGCNTYGPFETGNTGNCTITIAGNNGSIYLSSVTFFAPEAPELLGFSVAGEEMTIDNTAMTVTGDVSYNVDLTTAEPVVTIGGSATNYDFDGNYNGGVLTVTDGTDTLTYTVTVTNREQDTTPPSIVSVQCNGADVEMTMGGSLVPVDGTIVLTFNEEIVVNAEAVTVYAMKTDYETELGMVECNKWAEGASLYIQPVNRFYSNAIHMLSLGDMFTSAVTDVEGNAFSTMMPFMVQTEVVNINLANASVSDGYGRVAKFTLDQDFVIADTTAMTFTPRDPNDPMAYFGPAYVENIEVVGNNIYVLDVANYSAGTEFGFTIGTGFARGVYNDVLVEDPNYEGLGWAYVPTGADFTQGDNSYRIGYDVTIDDTYAMPSWISGEGISMDRDYAGADMTSGHVGAIRGNATATLSVNVPENSNVTLIVSATGGRNFQFVGPDGTVEATQEAAKNTLYPITVKATAGVWTLSTPGATGGFTVQGIQINEYTAVKGLNADKADVRYANRVIVNNGAKVEVYNIAGVCVARSMGNIDMSKMAKGVYVVRINGNETMKIVR